MMTGFKDVFELKKYYEDFYGWRERPCVKEDRMIVEGYFIDGTTSEDLFLSVCDCIDNQLYDDYKDFYEYEPWYIDLQKYTENLQRITGKKPKKQNRKWQYLEIETECDSIDKEPGM